MKKIILIIGLLISLGYSQFYSTDEILNKVFDAGSSSLTGAYNSSEAILNTVYDPTTGALKMTVTGGVFNLTADTDTLAFNVGTELYAIRLSMDGVNKFWVDTTGSAYYASDVEIGTNSVSGENPYLTISGYSTDHSAIKYGRLNVSAQGNLVIWGEVGGYLGAQGQSTYLFDNQGGAFIDDKRLRFGSDNDAMYFYDETTNDGLIFGLPVGSKRSLIIKNNADIANDNTGLIGTTNFPDINQLDDDEDSFIKYGWIADDEPEISANRTLDIQSSGGFALNIFGKSGVGENPLFKIWGDESGTPTFFSIAVEASGNVDINAEGNLEIGGQGTQVAQITNKWIQFLNQRGAVFGTDSQGDARFQWDESAHASGFNDALLLGVKEDTRGFIIGDHDLSTGNGGEPYDLTGLLATDAWPKLTILDADQDSYFKFGWSADDTPLWTVGGVATDINITANLNVTGEIKVTEATHLFAFFGDSTVTYEFASADTWYHLSNATTNLWAYPETDGFTVSNDTITVTNTGDYDLTAIMNMDGGNGTTYAIRFYNVTQTAGVPTAGGVTSRGSGNTDGVMVGAYGEFTAGDEIVLQIKGDSAVADVTLKSSIIKMYLVHL